MYKPKHSRKENHGRSYFVGIIGAVIFMIAFACLVYGVVCQMRAAAAVEVSTISIKRQAATMKVLQDTNTDGSTNAEQKTELQGAEPGEATEGYLEEKTYTDEEVKLLGDLMYAEEGVLFWTLPYEEAKLAHLLAGSVVIHRRNHERFEGASIEEIIYADGQYASTTLEKLGNIETPEEVYEWAEELLRDGPVGPTNLVWQAEIVQGPLYQIIDNQYFCLLEE